jgi:hypothetical protein|tara:strand:- start:15 stop:1184 length:1170 start_codon:yes stop_codon:yes gene_type:complete
MSKKNFITILISTFLSILLFYFLFFLKIHFEHLHKYPYRFKSIDTLKFNKNYYNKLHHLRNVDGKWEIKSKPENYLFSTINKFSINTDNILLQGDSWIQQLNEYKKSYNLINNFTKKNNFGLINAGIGSFSPSLMQLQYEILEKDFNIKPNIVVAYFDQTDLGDELCRYKDKRIYDKNNTLVAVKKEDYTRAIFEITKIFYISEVTLLYDSTLIRTLKLTNFFIKYGFLRFIDKLKTIKKFGWQNKDVAKCWLPEIRKYLIKSDNNEISYFENRVKDYINLLLTKEYIEKIILVTFPHHDHIFGYITSKNEKNYYSVNVSNIIEKIIKNNQKIYHLNFSQLISEGKINLEKNFFIENDEASHLKEEYHATIFTQKIINHFITMDFLPMN